MKLSDEVNTLIFVLSCCFFFNAPKPLAYIPSSTYEH